MELAAQQRGQVVRPAHALAGPRAAGPGAPQADVVEGGGGQGGSAVHAQAEGQRLRVVRGRGEQPGLHGGVRTGERHRGDPGPVRAVGGLVAGERPAGAGQPQPARGGRRDRAGPPGLVLGVVVLHSYAVAAGHHHRGVRRTRLGALPDDDPGLGPGHDAAAHRHALAVDRAVAGAPALARVVQRRDQAGQ